MLKGTRTAIIKRIQPVSIHGQISLDVFWVDPEDPEEEVRHARVGDESVPRGLEIGDKVTMHYLMGMVTRSRKTDQASGQGSGTGTRHPSWACLMPDPTGSFSFVSGMKIQKNVAATNAAAAIDSAAG